MKKYTVFFLFLFLIGCFDPGFSSDEGMYLEVANRTNNTYVGKQSLYIGAIKDDKFYVMDSISSYDTILPYIQNDVTFSRTTYIKEIQDWRPQIAKVSGISNQGAFLFTMSNGYKGFINPFSFPEPVIGRSAIRVYIEDNSILDHENINQDLEIIK